jgi:hypothetical protein
MLSITTMFPFDSDDKVTSIFVEVDNPLFPMKLKSTEKVSEGAD